MSAEYSVEQINELVENLMSCCRCIGYATSGNERANHIGAASAAKEKLISAFTHPPAQTAKPPQLGGCCCGEPCTLGVVHRTDGPCFHYVDPAQATSFGRVDLVKGLIAYTSVASSRVETKSVVSTNQANDVDKDEPAHAVQGNRNAIRCPDCGSTDSASCAAACGWATHPHSPDAADSGRVTETRLHTLLVNHRTYLVDHAGLFSPGSCMAQELDTMIALAAQGQGDAKHPNDWRGNIPVRGYESDMGGLFHSSDAAEQSGKFGIVWELVRSVDIPASPAGVPDVEFDEGDLFWPDDDGEQCAESMFNLLEDMHVNGQIEPGQVIRVRRARNLPLVEVTITAFENGDFCDYKLAAAPSATPEGGEVGL